MDWEAFYRRFREPDFITGYEIQNRLGGGAFGDVYKARKQSIGKAYAVKFLKLEDDTQRQVVERELSTVRHFAAIDHPNLVTIEDMGVAMGVPYLIMGYAGEATLARRLSKGVLDAEAALMVFDQVCRGVLALHDRRLVHFDLKPSNVFLKGDVARVGDYGLSKLLTDGRMTLSFGRGTPQYMAPEILRSRADHRADIYSLGVILYECLVGELPYKPERDSALVLRETDEAPEYPEGFPERLRPVVEGCLRLKPEDRYPDVGALLADLDKVDESHASGAPTGPRPRLRAEQEPEAQDSGAESASDPRAEESSHLVFSGDSPEPESEESGSQVKQTAKQLAKGAVAVAAGVWQGLRGADGELEQPDLKEVDAHARGKTFGRNLRKTGGELGRDLRKAGEDIGRAARKVQADVKSSTDSNPGSDASEDGDSSGRPAARAKAKALLREIATQVPAEVEGEFKSAAKSPAQPVPVPPKVEGGLVGTVTSTLVVAAEVLAALLASIGRGVYLVGKRVMDRLLRRSGSVVGRMARFGVFLALMTVLGFGLTLLGMVFLEALDVSQ